MAEPDLSELHRAGLGEQVVVLALEVVPVTRRLLLEEPEKRVGDAQSRPFADLVTGFIHRMHTRGQTGGRYTVGELGREGVRELLVGTKN